MGVPRRYSLTELACFPPSMFWLNWICALFFFMVLALPGCRGETWTEEDERLARERNLGRIISSARNNGKTLADFTSSQPFGSLSSQTRGSSSRTLGGFVSSRPSSGSVQSPLSQVLRGSASRVKFGGFSSDGFPSSKTSSSASQTSDRFPSTRTSSGSVQSPLSKVLSGSSRVLYGGFSSDGFPSSPSSSSATLTSDSSRTTARKPSQGSISSSSVSSQQQGSSAASSQRQGSSSGSSPRQGSSASYIPNFIGQSRGGFKIPQNIDTVYQNSFQTSNPRNSGPFQRPSQSFTEPISGPSQASTESTDRISGSFQVSQIMDKSSQTSRIRGCRSCHLALQGT